MALGGRENARDEIRGAVLRVSQFWISASGIQGKSKANKQSTLIHSLFHIPSNNRTILSITMKTTYSTLFGLLYGIVWSAPALPAATARLLHETADYDHNQFHYDHNNQGGGDYDDDDENQQPGTMDDDSSPSPSPSSAPSYSPSPSYNPSSSSLSPSPSLASNTSTAMDDDINPDHVARVAAWQEFGYV
jgi:hypothetical protein